MAATNLNTPELESCEIGMFSWTIFVLLEQTHTHTHIYCSEKHLDTLPLGQTQLEMLCTQFCWSNSSVSPESSYVASCEVAKCRATWRARCLVGSNGWLWQVEMSWLRGGFNFFKNSHHFFAEMIQLNQIFFQMGGSTTNYRWVFFFWNGETSKHWQALRHGSFGSIFHSEAWRDLMKFCDPKWVEFNRDPYNLGGGN